MKGEGGKGLGTAMRDEAGEVLVDSIAAARAVNAHPSTVRNWAVVGWLERKGKDGRGRTLFSLVDVYRTAEYARRDRKGEGRGKGPGVEAWHKMREQEGAGRCDPGRGFHATPHVGCVLR